MKLLQIAVLGYLLSPWSGPPGAPGGVSVFPWCSTARPRRRSGPSEH